MMRFGSRLASSRDKVRLITTSVQPFCRVWSRNYASAAEDTKRFIDFTKYQKKLVKVLNSVGREEGQDIRQGARMAVDAVMESLNSRVRRIATFDEIAQFGTAASNGDREIGEFIAKAFERGWGNDLQVLADGETPHNELQLYEGMIIDSGYLFNHFTNQKTKKCALQRPAILVHEKKFASYDIMFELLRSVAPERGRKGRDILIVAEDVENDLLATLVLHGMSTGTKVCVIKPPGFGECRKASLWDIAKVTKSKVVTQDFELKSLSNWFFLGSAWKITVSKDQAVILRYLFSNDYGQGRFTMENLQDFPAKHSNLVAALQVGGTNKAEVSEKKDRVANAVNVTKAAKEEGVGSGIALLYAFKELDKLQTTNSAQKIGFQTIQNALKMLLKTIASNLEVEGPFDDKQLKQDIPNLGYDQAEGEYVNKLMPKVVFPLKTIRTVLMHATSEMCSYHA